MLEEKWPINWHGGIAGHPADRRRPTPAKRRANALTRANNLPHSAFACRLRSDLHQNHRFATHQKLDKRTGLTASGASSLPAFKLAPSRHSQHFLASPPQKLAKLEPHQKLPSLELIQKPPPKTPIKAWHPDKHQNRHHFRHRFCHPVKYTQKQTEAENS